MRAFVVDQTVFLIHDRPVTPGHLRAGDVGRVIALDGDCAWAEFPLGAIQHKELIKLGDVGLVCCPDPTCGTKSDKHSDGCSLAMNTSEMHRPIPPGAREGVW